MVKGFSENKSEADQPIQEINKEKKGLAGFLKGKQITYTFGHL